MPVDNSAPRVDDPITGYLTADWHFPELAGRGPWAAADVGGDAAHALAQIVGLCVRAGADLYAAGDLFDGPDPTPEALSELYAVLRPLAAAGLTVYYVLGNHDRGRDWLLPLGPAAVRLDGRVVDTPLGSVTGTSFLHPSEFDRWAAAPKPWGADPPDVGLYHQTWCEFVNGGRTSVGALPRHRLAVCGDVHVRGCVSGTGPVTALSPGPLAPQSVTEFGVGHTAFGVGADLVPRPVALTGRKFLYLVVDTREDLDRAMAAAAALSENRNLPRHLWKPFVSVRADAALDDAAVDQLCTRARDRGAVVRLVRTTARSAPTDGAPAVVADSLAAAIAAWPARDRVRGLAAALTNTNDPAALLRAAYKESRSHGGGDDD